MTILDRFFEVEREAYGKADYHLKQDCTSSKIIAFYIRLFNPTYLTQFTTMRYPDTYFPGRKKDGPKSCVRTEFHENVHKWDRHHEGIKFSLKYAFPQIAAAPFIVAAVVLGGPLGWMGFGVLLALLHGGLGVLAVSASKVSGDHPVPSKGARVAAFVLAGSGAAACVVGSVIGGGLWSLLWAPAALFLSPWPFKAVWRRDAEIRGYTATLYRVWLEYGEIWDSVILQIVKNFTGPGYFFMETDGVKVEKELQFQMSLFTGTGIPDAPSGEAVFLERWNNQWIAGPGSRDRREMAEPFRMISKFMKEEGMIHGA